MLTGFLIPVPLQDDICIEIAQKCPLQTIIIFHFSTSPSGLFMWDYVSELIKQPELFFYNKYWLRFIVVWVRNMGADCSNAWNSSTSHFFPEELDQWVTGLDINMITASQAGSHTASPCFYNAHAHRAFSQSGRSSGEEQDHLSSFLSSQKASEMLTKLHMTKLQNKNRQERIPGTVCL